MGSQIQIIESAGAEVPARRIHHDSHTGQNFGISARSQTPKSFATAIRADIGESEAYKQALLRGEIGLQRPMGANVRGVDFITAVREGATGIKNIICTDVKTSERGKFPSLSRVFQAVGKRRFMLLWLVSNCNSEPLMQREVHLVSSRIHPPLPS